MNDIAPTCIVIFGVTGDLASRKLFPALYDLFLKDSLPKQFRIVGFSRRPLLQEEFAKIITDALAKKNPASADLEKFLAHCFYQQGNFDEQASYVGLAKKLAETDEKEFGQCSNKLFYLSVPPDLYEGIFRELATSGLTIPCGGKEGWTRVLVEKPFGRDSATAAHLDATLGKLFDESQIFRIDHYLAKETLQNILTFRFSNSIFEPVWNAEHIERVDIRLLEKLDLQGRGAFYDEVGTLRDVGQNHMLQMLALVAMEKPLDFSAEHIREKRADVFRKLLPISGDDMDGKVVRGQYAGFRDEKNVKPDSETETYFRIEAAVDNPRWKGVPFVLEAGKALDRALAEIVVHFRKSSPVCFSEDGTCGSNMLTFRIQPDEGISLRFFTKIPGLQFQAEPRMFEYLSKDSEAGRTSPDAYEKVLYDCVRGDQTLFTSTAEVGATWAYMTPIVENLSRLQLHIYEKGTDSSRISSL